MVFLFRRTDLRFDLGLGLMYSPSRSFAGPAQHELQDGTSFGAGISLELRTECSGGSAKLMVKCTRCREPKRLSILVSFRAFVCSLRSPRRRSLRSFRYSRPSPLPAGSLQRPCPGLDCSSKHSISN